MEEGAGEGWSEMAAGIRSGQSVLRACKNVYLLLVCNCVQDLFALCACVFVCGYACVCAIRTHVKSNGEGEHGTRCCEELIKISLRTVLRSGESGFNNI